MYFDRKVKYLDYVENGERIKGAGFVKIEVRDQVCRMQICVRGLHVTDHYEKQVILTADKQESILCKIKIEGGEGNTGELCMDSERMGRGELRYAQLEEIRIPIAAGKEIRCTWRDKRQAGASKAEAALVEATMDETVDKSVLDVREEVEKTEAAEREVAREQEKTFEQEVAREQEKTFEQKVARNQEETWMGRATYEGVEKNIRKPDVASADILMAEDAKMEKVNLAEKEMTKAQTDSMEESRQILQDDKWSQLVAIYPHIAPFEDEREYLSLGPGDFVIFPSRYYRMVNNSFLLHGYHNYRHLILSRLEIRGEIRYYVGVPGNFYDKEKQVAMMFGFESFECKQEPARSGDYGYYMMRVEL
ncbi:MAG: DUF6128 domain-containing protein [Candidatus Gastranaerophilales bacterium]|nr:DUF6128 domain-containing protein [Candidatus Gastranaerophilales bacterium]